MTEFEEFVFGRLTGIAREDMTKAESQIAQWLVDGDEVAWYEQSQDNEHSVCPNLYVLVKIGETKP